MIESWVRGYLGRMNPDVVRLQPAEPLGAVSFNVDYGVVPCAVIELVELRIERVRRPDGNDLLIISPTKGSERVIEQWMTRWRESDMEEFNWFPRFDKQKAAAG